MFYSARSWKGRVSSQRRYGPSARRGVSGQPARNSIAADLESPINTSGCPQDDALLGLHKPKVLNAVT
jgi:hypothetical protein